MTHDELLAMIDAKIQYWTEEKEAMPLSKNGSQLDVKHIESELSAWKALRAVVELHKPVSDGGCCGRDGDLVCNSCPDDQIREGHNAIYPCPTIQAIEKEL